MHANRLTLVAVRYVRARAHVHTRILRKQEIDGRSVYRLDI